MEESKVLAEEDAAENLDGEEESIPGMNPVRVAWIEAAGGNDAVEVRMQAHVLYPGVQDAEEADPGLRDARDRLRLQAWSERRRGKADRRVAGDIAETADLTREAEKKRHGNRARGAGPARDALTSAGAPGPDTSGSADCDRSYRCWPGDRIPSRSLEIKCIFPGPQLPAQTANFPVI